jgi:hypothetical protein
MIIETNDILGYTGFSMLSVNFAPVVLNVLKDYIEIPIHENMNHAVMISNIVAGSLILSYAILEGLKPIYMTVPVIISLNTIALILKMSAWFKNKREQQLF